MQILRYVFVVLGISRTDLTKRCDKYEKQVRIERSNRFFREKFYADLTEHSVVGARRELMKFLQKYNAYHPHASLRRLAPPEYISKYSSGSRFRLTSI